MGLNEAPARVVGLKEDGYNIETSKTKDPYRVVYYRLISGPGAVVAKEKVDARQAEDEGKAKPKYRVEYDPREGIARQVRVA
jgi:hypothetical protein